MRLLSVLLLLCICGAPIAAKATPPSETLSVSAEALNPVPEPPLEASPAEPSAKDLEHARNLFQRGVELADEGQYGAAAQRFREALAIRQAPAVAYNLASALFELRQYEESFNRVQSVLQDPATNAALRGRAQKLERALYPFVARLTVMASSTAADDVAVSIDGVPLERGAMGVPRAVKPGVHHLSAERQGRSVSEREIQVPLRTAVIVDVSLIITEQTAAQAVVTTPEVAPVAVTPLTNVGDDKRDDARRRKVWLWTGVAQGIALVGAGVALAVVFSKPEPKEEAGTRGDFMPGVLTWK